MPVIAVGMSHHNAGVDALTEFTAAARLAAAGLGETAGVHGHLLLSTCNRCELYIDADRFHVAVKAVRRLLTAAGAGHLAEQTDTLAARSAVEHLFQVVCGLDSMVVGETEIAGQVRGALLAGSEQVSPALQRLFQMALTTSKMVTSTTALGSLGRSVASVALDLAETRHGSLQGREALVIGTGSYAGVVTAQLTRRGAAISVHSPSGRADLFAETHPVQALDEGALPAALGRVAVVVSCSGNGAHTLTRQMLTAARDAHASVLPVIDLALGRDVDPALAECALIDLIDLDVVGENTPTEHLDALARARAVVEEAVETYLSVERGRLADPAVTAIRSHVNEIVARELTAVNAQQSPEVAEAIGRSLRRVANALLHTPSLRATESARVGDLADYAKALETVFGIEVDR